MTSWVSLNISWNLIDMDFSDGLDSLNILHHSETILINI